MYCIVFPIFSLFFPCVAMLISLISIIVNGNCLTRLSDLDWSENSILHDLLIQLTKF